MKQSYTFNFTAFSATITFFNNENGALTCNYSFFLEQYVFKSCFEEIYDTKNERWTIVVKSSALENMFKGFIGNNNIKQVFNTSSNRLGYSFGWDLGRTVNNSYSADEFYISTCLEIFKNNVERLYSKYIPVEYKNNSVVETKDLIEYRKIDDSKSLIKCNVLSAYGNFDKNINKYYLRSLELMEFMQKHNLKSFGGLSRA